VDLKAFVALTSVAHIGNGIIGLLSLSEEGVSGALLMALAHGLVSPSLFLIAGGALYGAFGTRLVYAYRGVIVLIPALATLLFAPLFANIAVPMSPN
jgi:NADH-ubiquinone oxidoreductase chain 4